MSPQHRELERVQGELEKLYELEPAPAIGEFVDIQESHEAEELLVYESGDGLELRLLLPRRDKVEPSLSHAYLELVEGVSHYLLVVERARTGLPTTLLELELQAEVDKFALLTLNPDAFGFIEGASVGNDNGQRTADRIAIHEWLFETGTYLHSASTQAGDRYRAANRLAARYWSRLMAQENDTRGELRRFYRAGPHEKIRLAKAI